MKKNFINSFLTFSIIFSFILLIIFNVSSSIVSVKNALILWVNNILPTLFPFMFFTSLLSLTNSLDFVVNSLGKIFNKIFKAPLISSYIFIMSSLCGYPMGVALTGEYINKNLITQKQGNKILTFCSQSGPLFVVGTVGICFFDSVKIGIIILIVHLISSLICGLLLRNFNVSNNQEMLLIKNKSDNILYEAMNKSINSILIVGGYIVIFSIIIDLLMALEITQNFIIFLSKFLNIDKNLVRAIIIGMIEMTRGIKELSLLNLNLKTVITITACIISFSGMSIFLQSFALCKMNKKSYFFSKILHTIICLIICLIFL